MGDYKKAFFHYFEGNKLRKEYLNYNIDDDKKYFQKIRQSYYSIVENSLECRLHIDVPTPIFILGMPRSVLL